MKTKDTPKQYVIYSRKSKFTGKVKKTCKLKPIPE